METNLQTEVAFVLYGEYTDLNTYIAAERSHRQKAAKIKRDETWRVRCEIVRMFGTTARVMEKAYPLHITFTWYTKNERRDPDNTAYGSKAILDGLVTAKLLRNDGRKEIASITHLFQTDKTKPRVEVLMQTKSVL